MARRGRATDDLALVPRPGSGLQPPGALPLSPGPVPRGLRVFTDRTEARKRPPRGRDEGARPAFRLQPRSHLLCPAPVRPRAAAATEAHGQGQLSGHPEPALASTRLYLPPILTGSDLQPHRCRNWAGPGSGFSGTPSGDPTSTPSNDPCERTAGPRATGRGADLGGRGLSSHSAAAVSGSTFA